MAMKEVLLLGNLTRWSCSVMNQKIIIDYWVEKAGMSLLITLTLTKLCRPMLCLSINPKAQNILPLSSQFLHSIIYSCSVT